MLSNPAVLLTLFNTVSDYTPQSSSNATQKKAPPLQLNIPPLYAFRSKRMWTAWSLSTLNSAQSEIQQPIQLFLFACKQVICKIFKQFGSTHWSSTGAIHIINPWTNDTIVELWYDEVQIITMILKNLVLLGVATRYVHVHWNMSKFITSTVVPIRQLQCIQVHSQLWSQYIKKISGPFHQNTSLSSACNCQTGRHLHQSNTHSQCWPHQRFGF